MAGTQLYAGLHRSANISAAHHARSCGHGHSHHSHHSHPSPKSPSTKSRDHQGIGGLERTSLQHLLLNWWPPSTFAYAQNCIDIPMPAASICSNHDQQPINLASTCPKVKNSIECSAWCAATFAPASNEHEGMPNTAAKTYTQKPAIPMPATNIHNYDQQPSILLPSATRSKTVSNAVHNGQLSLLLLWMDMRHTHNHQQWWQQWCSHHWSPSMMTTSLPTSASHPPSQMKPTTYSIDNSNQLTKPAPWQQWWHNCWCQWCQTQINHTGATTMHNMLIMLGMLTTNSLMMPSTLWPDPPSCTSHQPHTDSSLLTPYSALLCLTNTWKTWQSPARYHPALPECDPFIHHPWLHHNIYPTISNQDHLPCLSPLTYAGASPCVNPTPKIPPAPPHNSTPSQKQPPLTIALHHKLFTTIPYLPAM